MKERGKWNGKTAVITLNIRYIHRHLSNIDCLTALFASLVLLMTAGKRAVANKQITAAFFCSQTLDFVEVHHKPHYEHSCFRC
jgi:hypothetical protein